MKSSYKRFIREYVYTYKYSYIKILMVLVIQSFITMYIPLITSNIVDKVLPERNEKLFLLLLILMIAGYIVTNLINIYKDYHVAKTAENIIFKLRYNLNSKISKLENSFFKNNSFSDVISKYDKEIFSIKQNCGYMLVETIGNVVKLTIITCFMLSINKPITLVCIVTLFLYYLNSKYWSKLVKTAAEENMSLNASVIDIITENYNNVHIIKIYNAYNYIKKSFVNRYNKFIKNSIKLEVLYSANINLSSVIILLSLGLLWLIGGYYIFKGIMTIGELLAMISYNSMLLGPIRFLSQFSNSFQGALVSIDRIYSILDHKEDQLGTIILDEKIDSISFKNVSFSYDDKKILNNVDFEIESGKIAAIVGLSGAGKSTITNLLTGISKPNTGEIYVNETSINNIDINSLRNNISLVTQESLFFRNTIMQNLNLNSSYRLEEIISLCKELDIYDDLIKLPNGLEYVLSEGASDLSVGQRKRLDIVRAVLKNPQIIIFDESTAGLDVMRRDLFFSLLNRIKENKIIILITHNLNELSKVDDVYILNNGNINVADNLDVASLMVDLAKRELEYA
ncbi:ABC transporter ATP-binding protein [Clostridioides sp. ES-S-0001-02]|uniref:ABC transporter ATP-binding protein n=1 Tax=Clostridioides sp. ES-S-0001-02 TaxID=2770770 RepID=UPI001D10B078|nr:ABC transporter ATP-binding protein [Clostridioides sp. ES-S-0001-02]